MGLVLEHYDETPGPHFRRDYESAIDWLIIESGEQINGRPDLYRAIRHLGMIQSDVQDLPESEARDEIITQMEELYQYLVTLLRPSLEVCDKLN